MSSGLPTQPLRNEHSELLPRVESLRAAAALVGEAPPATVETEIDGVLDFLETHLIPHAQAEDVALYPIVEKAIGAAGATDTMRRDHVEVMRLTDELRRIRERLAAAGGHAHDQELRRVLYGLYGIVTLHFAKEEEVYLPILDEWLDDDSAAQLFDSMERAAADAKSSVARVAATP